MNATALKRAKRAARAQVLAQRDALSPADRALMGGRIVERFLDLPEMQGVRIAMAFWSFGSEVPTDPLIASLAEVGVTLALPRIVDGQIEPRMWAPGEPVTQTRFGALEPEGGRLLDAAQIDVVATPGVVFDRAGGRVGYGGGFYDRFFPRTPALRVAVAFALQVVEGPVPGASFDLPVQLIVTESETIRCSG
ncbi:MAG: 5-formyltetrahydrofolate cyclo-ligase [Actinomycetota bacterium]